MNKFKITIPEINYFSKLVGGMKGFTLDEMKLAQKLETDVMLNEDDIKKSGFKQNGGRVEWTDTKFKKEIELSDDKFKLLKKTLKSQTDEAIKDKKTLDEMRYLLEVDKIINEKPAEKTS